MPEPVEHPPAPELRVFAHDPDWKAAQVGARDADATADEPVVDEQPVDEGEPDPIELTETPTRGRHEKADTDVRA